MNGTLQQTQYGQDFDRYVWIANRKMELEQQIRINANDENVIADLRSEYRRLVEESDRLYSKYHKSFNEQCDEKAI